MTVCMTPRIRKPRTVTLSVQADEGLEILAGHANGNASAVVDQLIRAEMVRLGFILNEQEKGRPRMKVEIVVGGVELPLYLHNGEVFLPAPLGKSTEYSIRLINDSPKRRLAVLSVDGVNVVDGKDAEFKGGGYVLDPWMKTDIHGFLRGDKEAASFTFSEVGKSYAAKTGRGTKNVGVIGCAVFDEKEYPHQTWTFSNPRLSDFQASLGNEALFSASAGPDAEHTNTVIGAASMDAMKMFDASPASDTRKGVGGRTERPRGGAATRHRHRGQHAEPDARLFRSQDVGTEYGRRVEMLTQTVAFQRASDSPAEVIRIRYASREALLSWGVPVNQAVPGRPEAFPAEQPRVPEPPGWKG